MVVEWVFRRKRRKGVLQGGGRAVWDKEGEGAGREDGRGGRGREAGGEEEGVGKEGPSQDP